MQPLIARRPVANPAMRGAARPVRRDPAPSKWAYRAQRMMLTPYVRMFLRTGLPTLLVVGGAAIWLSSAQNRDMLVSRLTDMREEFEARPEFRVSLASIEGASDDLAEAVRSRLALALPMSSFDIDLDAVRGRIEALDAVKKADLRVRSGGVLQVVITERIPVAVWRTDAGLTLVDDGGHRVAGLLSRADRPDLPLIAGDGADLAAAEALDLIAAAGPLSQRIRGLVRMGERRWDIVLDREQRILLPEDNPVQALERLLALDHVQDIMNRDILSVDLRSDHRPTLRLSPNALRDMRRAQGIETVENEL
ncbi:cell division protein FtsQ/DivIB [Tabrizicola sp.]|uniref:cell division protein FtsQ/DivIB n=1 Tax=Tabrizicola sp. TaxID=2005166 RepID=UPI00262BFE34|nr:cell division protein FtsQ/DivIB [Tabrizicola sp.]MDM7931949.1 cell division protein FtsQ/DivIB [Tabrizicola sp.]